MGSLQGKCAVVTGGGSGVGLAVAKAFLAAGAKVAIAGRDAAKLQKAAATLSGGDNLVTLAADVSDAAQAAGLMEQATAALGRIDILVNNAGLNLKARKVRDLTVEQWRQLIGTNLDGVFYCTKAVLPQMIARNDGIIININSISGLRANPLGGSGYVASKYGLTGLGLCLAAEERESNIRVCNIHPGEIDTPILDNRPVPVTAEQRQVILQADDVAAAVLFVATLPARASVPELVIKPTVHVYF